ncbi:MAG: hypothetical protein ACYS9V_09580 [Planctomycetota bacterium]
MDVEKRSSDKAAQEMIKRMAEAGQQNAWDRLDAQLPQCGFGKQGICCRICAMGPCRISKKASLGVCGADADTIVARNFLRAVASGVSAHSDHGRTVAEVFLATANGQAPDYKFKDTIKLNKLAEELGVETANRIYGRNWILLLELLTGKLLNLCIEVPWVWTRIIRIS